MPPRPTRNVIVSGSINLDIAMHTTPRPDAGEALRTTHSALQCGGKGARQAITAARLGASVAMIGAVGDELVGHMLCDALYKAGVDDTFVARLPGERSGTEVVVFTPGGEERVMLAGGANSALGASHLHAAAPLFESARVLLCELDTPLAAVRAALDLAALHGVTAILNAAPASRLDTELLTRIDVLVVNEAEARELSAIAPIDHAQSARAARILQARGARFVVILLGARGALLLQGDCVTHFGAAVPNLADTANPAAARDTLSGAFAAALASGMPIADAVHFSLSAAALCGARHDAQQAMPVLAELVGTRLRSAPARMRSRTGH